MPVFTFSSKQDALYMRKRDEEKHRLYYLPRRYLVNNDQITLNIYGEPGTPISASDGATSVKATRQLTSALSTFVSSGVLPSDVLEIQTPPCNHSDNGKYQINTVVDENTIEITEDWPVGELTDLVFKVHFLKERYTEFDQLVPFLVKLNPTEKELTKWGINDKRDAIIQFSIELCQSIGLVPKIGDRFVYPYEDKDIHYEIKNLFEADQLGDSSIPLHYLGLAMKTTSRLP